MSPVLGTPVSAGSLLVFIGEDCVTVREILRIHLADTTWAIEAQPDDAIDEIVLANIARRRCLAERATA